ncbi:MAG: M1 family metallopeptidase [Chitinophagaceae bacterium]
MYFNRLFLITFSIFLLFQACKPSSSDNTVTFDKSLHSFSNSKEIICTHLNWDAQVDFDRKHIAATATWNFKNNQKAKYLHLDTYKLTIEKIKVNDKEVTYNLTPHIDEYGSGLSIPVQDGDSIVSIKYTTSTDATALQWLAPEQTAGKKMPYLFTQCESIHARSIIPCQDLPSNRITYQAQVQVPKGMLAIMSAKNPTQKNESGIYTFNMEIPIPTYLIALAVGDIAYQAIDYRCGVYTEPSMLKKASNELKDMPKMMAAAEKLGGPYRWGKYDVLIAPPSFPIGGMENPRLTFATPTIIAGDKSLVSLIAHEMAHSWSGNLVTNATWDDLWLNEGFTTYFERRIMEEITDKSYTNMLWEIGYQDMQSDFTDLGKEHEDTRLKVNLTVRHPGDAFSNIPYEKGAYFLKMLEENMGRDQFDAFMTHYFNTHAFKPTTTEDCIAFMDKYLFQNDTTKRNKLLVKEWIYQPGLPQNCIHQTPIRFEEVDKQRTEFENTGNPTALKTIYWSTHEWLHFLRKLPHPLPQEKMKKLDTYFNLSETNNSEIAMEWFKLSIASDYEVAYANLALFLNTVGRKKFLEPLYSELLKNPNTKSKAKDIFEHAKQNYHPQTAQKIESIVSKN